MLDVALVELPRPQLISVIIRFSEQAQFVCLFSSWLALYLTSCLVALLSDCLFLELPSSRIAKFSSCILYSSLVAWFRVA